MALFDKKNFEKLMAELAHGDNLIASLESLTVLSIPLETANEHNLMEKIKALAPYAQMTALSSRIMEKLEKLKELEEKKKAKKDAVNERRKLNYKRKREEEGKTEAKKMKLSDLKQQEPSKNVQQKVTGAAGNPTDAVIKNTITPKRAVTKPTLLQKALKDAFKIKKQFK
ncbi:hypothetical protein CAEBREN_03905 [Caenorhabditis brenneri]|uniref:Uncharacterized protein n=1 Tax=Caenorhabditis brenneri TaxID=135651 RepID=G0PH70_CAEBE|nr:hypothetical protein CAEBREN_03905 [Caenorhabditis brenneri]